MSGQPDDTGGMDVLRHCVVLRDGSGQHWLGIVAATGGGVMAHFTVGRDASGRLVVEVGSDVSLREVLGEHVELVPAGPEALNDLLPPGEARS